MAFPSVTAVIDDFNRSNETELSGSWSPYMVAAGGSNDFGVSSNELYAADGAFNGYYWTGGTFGPDGEVRVEVPTFVTNIVFVAHFRFTYNGSFYDYDSYAVRLHDFGTPRLQISKYVGGAHTSLSLYTPASINNGDSFGLRVVGDSLKAYHNDTERISITNSDITSGDRVGLYGGANSSWRMDNFAAGTISDIGADYQMNTFGVSIY